MAIVDVLDVAVEEAVPIVQAGGPDEKGLKKAPPRGVQSISKTIKERAQLWVLAAARALLGLVAQGSSLFSQPANLGLDSDEGERGSLLIAAGAEGQQAPGSAASPTAPPPSRGSRLSLGKAVARHERDAPGRQSV